MYSDFSLRILAGIAFHAVGAGLAFGDGVWKRTNVEDTYFYSFAAQGGALFAGSASAGVYASQDDGRTWSEQSTCFDGIFNSVYSIHASEGIIAATFDGAGVCISRDGGDSWEASNNGLRTQPYLRAIARSGRMLFAGSVANVSGPTIYRTPAMDGELKWVRSDSGIPSGVTTVERILATPEGVLVAGISQTRVRSAGTVFLSKDSGQSWIPTESVFPYLVFDMVHVAGVLLLATEHGVFRSENLGRTWEAPTGEPPRNEFYSLAGHGKSIYAGSDRDGLFTSLDYGKSWTKVSSDLPLAGNSVAAIGVGKSSILVALAPGNEVWILDLAGTSLKPSLSSPNLRGIFPYYDVIGRRFTATERTSHLPFMPF